jgi:hypothetical protein
VLDDCASKCTSLSRESIAAAVDPHRLAALAGALVRHAGGAPGRSYDLAALDPVCLRSNDNCVGALVSHCWRCKR